LQVKLDEMAKKKPVTLQEHFRKISPLGGKTRMASLSEQERHEFAQKGGLVGGRARAQKLSSKRRSEIARKAAAARWAKAKERG
jgi:hypothetical protein